MRRADRLFQLVQLIRGRRLSTAEFLAERLEVSPRTVYRDVAALQGQGVPIEGEAGVGYRMKGGFDLAPLMFGKREAQALVAALRMSQPSLDSGLAAAAESALSKIMAVLPAEARAAAESLTLFAPLSGLTPEVRELLAALREATESRRKLALEYVSLDDERSHRTVRPLACFFWGPVWTLAAWCELRKDFRSFRVDRISALQVLDETFRDEPGKTLADMNRRQEQEDHP
jgi:predicted DNA-binding transcriptional regulator YafY